MNLSPAVDNSVDNRPPLWDAVKERLRAKVGPINFNIWFSPILDGKMNEDQLVIRVPNQFIADWITDYYLEMIEQEGSQVANKPLRVRFHIQEEERKRVEIPFSPLSPKGPVLLKTTPPLNTKYTFDTFVVGSGNQLAHAAAQAVAKLPGAHYNPLFIYGGVGLGKTHLLHAIGNTISKHHPGMKIISLSAEKFMIEFIHCVQNNRMADFRKKYRTNCDILLIDDIQFLGGKESTQHEFFHTFNDLHHSQRQIVVTSDKIPKEIHGLEPRLRSRFEWGLIADIQIPDLETRIAIVYKKAEEDKISIGEEVAMYLAQTIQSNVRELEGALIRLHAFASLTGAPITLALAKEVLKGHSHLMDPLSKKATVESVQQIVADYYQVNVAELKSHRRLKTLAFPRQVAMYLCKKHLKLSYPEIGQRFGGKDHTTVIHAYRKIEALLEIDSHLQNDISILEKTII